MYQQPAVPKTKNSCCVPERVRSGRIGSDVVWCGLTWSGLFHPRSLAPVSRPEAAPSWRRDILWKSSRSFLNTVATFIRLCLFMCQNSSNPPLCFLSPSSSELQFTSSQSGNKTARRLLSLPPSERIITESRPIRARGGDGGLTGWVCRGWKEPSSDELSFQASSSRRHAAASASSRRVLHLQAGTSDMRCRFQGLPGRYRGVTGAFFGSARRKDPSGWEDLVSPPDGDLTLWSLLRGFKPGWMRAEVELTKWSLRKQ